MGSNVPIIISPRQKHFQMWATLLCHALQPTGPNFCGVVDVGLSVYRCRPPPQGYIPEIAHRRRWREERTGRATGGVNLCVCRQPIERRPGRTGDYKYTYVSLGTVYKGNDSYYACEK